MPTLERSGGGTHFISSTQFVTRSTTRATITGVFVAESIKMKPTTRSGIGWDPVKAESPLRFTKTVALVVYTVSGFDNSTPAVHLSLNWKLPLFPLCTAVLPGTHGPP